MKVEIDELTQNVSDDFKKANPQLFCTNNSVENLQMESKSGVKTNKYHVADKADRTHNGILFDSKKEMQKAIELDLQVKAGEIDFYLRQVPIPLPGGDMYRADFVTFEQGRKENGETFWWIEVIECKGIWTALGKNKFNRFKKAYPNLKIRVE